MSLFLNGTDHWEIPGQGELHSGDPVEVFLDGKWATALVDYRPRVGYTLRLPDGQTLKITGDLEIRVWPEIARNMGKNP